MVKTLLAHRADPNGVLKLSLSFRYYCRALAIFHAGHIQNATPWVRYLADQEGNTALGVAACAGKASVMCALLDAKANVDHGNWRGMTAQTLAERGGHPQLLADVVTHVSATAKAARRLTQRRLTQRKNRG